MKIILCEDVVSLGIEGDVIEVADGYARNFLIPKNLAVKVTKGSLKDLEFKRKAIERREAERIKEAEKYAAKFKDKKIKDVVQVNETGKLYGSVTVTDVAKLIYDQLGEDIDNRMIILGDQIKEVGNYEVTLRVHPEVEAKLTLEVSGEQVEVPEELKDEELKAEGETKEKAEEAKEAAKAKSKKEEKTDEAPEEKVEEKPEETQEKSKEEESSK
ncbi:MAG: 50S ribosomal protein L9 [Actinobacteria bacterium]|nr:MAG: 50S ribosomal protein L9 [Actinomycetota bacterium]